MSSRFIHVVAGVRISFLSGLHNIPLCGCTSFYIPVPLWMDTRVASPVFFHLERLFLQLFWVFHSPGHPAPNTGLYVSPVTELRDIVNPLCPASLDHALEKKILETFAGLQTGVQEVDKRPDQVTGANTTTCLICLPQTSKPDAVRVAVRAPTPPRLGAGHPRGPWWWPLVALLSKCFPPTACPCHSFCLLSVPLCFFLLPCLVSGFPILGPGGGPSGSWLWGPATSPHPPPLPPGTSSVPAPAMKPLRASPALAD